MSDKPLNAVIAEALGWRTWEDLRPGQEGNWFQESDKHVFPVPDYIRILQDTLWKMNLPQPKADVKERT